MSLNHFIQEERPQLLLGLHNWLNTEERNHTSPLYQDTILYLKSITSRGKLLRSSFVWYLYKTFENDYKREDILHLATALELLQTALLIHDDIIDQDTVRRGTDTMHTHFSQIASSIIPDEDKKKYGEYLAICGGNIAIFSAMKALHSIGDVQLRQFALHHVSQEMQTVCFGEMMDIQMSYVDKTYSIDEIIGMYRFKTARYSIALPFYLGGFIAGFTAETQTDLYSIGEDIGILFQIKDDDLGFRGSKESIGKNVGNDIRENKKTIHRALLMRYTEGKDLERVRSSFGNERLTDKDIQTIQHMFEYNNVIVHEYKEIINKLETTITNKMKTFSDTRLENYVSDVYQLVTNRKA